MARNVFYVLVTAIALALLLLSPPQLDLRLTTILSVLLVAVFLAFSQHPTQAAGKSYAPLTAVVAASSIVFGYWTMLLVIVSFCAIRLRMGEREHSWRELLSPGALGQAGAGVLATYGMIAVWGEVLAAQKFAPAWAGSAIAFFGVLLVGIVWQFSQHFFVQTAYFITRGAGFSLQFVRIGIFASLYGYLLVAMYGFGGMLAAALFYVLVAQTRVVQDILGVVKRLEQLEAARTQAASVISDAMRFTDVPGVQYVDEVKNISQMLARHLGLSRKEIGDIGLAAELHEIGKSRLPARLRWGEPGNAAEENQRRTYSRLGAIMLRSADALVEPVIADYVEYHTEHFDGSGYPKGLVGEAIPQASRIVALAKAYVALLTGYGGGAPTSKEEALRTLHGKSGTLYDPRLVDLLTEVVS